MKNIQEKYKQVVLGELFSDETNLESIKIFQFLNGVKKNNRQENDVLKKFCKQHLIDFRLTKNNLLEIFSTFKRVEVWGA